MLLSPIFEVLSQDDRSVLTKAATLKTLKRGKPLWRTGERVAHFAIVRSGLLGVTLGLDGDDETLCGVFRKDDTLLNGLEMEAPAPMTVKALTSVDIAWIPTSALTPLLRENWRAVTAIFRHTTERLYAQRFLAAVLLNASIEKRLAYAYWSMSTTDRLGRRVIEQKASQLDVAKLIGTSREEVSRRSALLEQSQYLSAEDGVMVLSEHLPLLFLSETEVPAFLSAEFGIF